MSKKSERPSPENFLGKTEGKKTENPPHRSTKVFKPEEWNLSNGIPVILQNTDGPVASIYWWVKTGSADELPKEAGFAHFLEHMHFKDTDAKTTGRASSGEMARAIESLGGDINAYTSFDQTVYHVTCAAQHWEKVLKVFGTMAKPQKFLKDDFQREREVILEELKKNEDSPSRMLFQDLFTAVYPKHPYGRPVIGYTKTLKAAKVSDLERFYRRQYVSENMGLVLVGPYEDTRRKKIGSLLEDLYGKKAIPKKSAKSPSRKFDSETEKEFKLTKRHFDVKMPSYCLAFRIPNLQHEDLPALDLLASIFGMGEMSRLYQRLFYTDAIVTEVGAGIYVPRDPGMFYFSVEVDAMEKIGPSLRTLIEEMKRIQVDGPTEEELARVIVNSESERYYASQSADGIAGRLGFLKLQVNDLFYDQKYIEHLKNLDGQTLQSIARKYFDPRRMVGSFMIPKTEKDFSLKEVESILKAEFPKGSETKSISKTKQLPQISSSELIPEVIDLDSGVKVLYFERPNSPLMSVHAASLGGSRLESPEHQGASQLLAMTWNKGTLGRSANEITEMIEGSASSLDGFAGRNTIGMQLTGLARDWDKLSHLFSEILLQPTFKSEELQHSKRVTEESIRSIEDHSSALCSKLFLETLFEKHPYGRHVSGTLETVARIDSQILSEYHQKWVNPKNLCLSVVGNVSGKNLDRFLKELDSSMKAHSKSSLSSSELSKGVLDEAPLKGPRWVERNLKREQVHLIKGGLGIKLMDDERYALRLLSNILGGQSGRLFIELREKKSMAYSVAPITLEGMENGYVATYIACSPSKKEEALKGIQKVYEDFVKKGPSPAEMKRAKEYYLGRRAMDLQGDSSMASYFTLEKIYGLPFRTEGDITKKIEGVTAAQIRDVCERLYIKANLITACVG
jgi:zinc protease